MKGTIWISLLLFIGVEIGISMLFALLLLPFILLNVGIPIVALILYIILVPALAPFLAIPMQLGIEKVRGVKPTIDIALNCLNYWLPLYLTLLFIVLISMLFMLSTIGSMLPVFKSSALIHIIQFKDQQFTFQQITWTPEVWQSLFYLIGIFFAGLTVVSFVALFLMFSLPLVVNENLKPLSALWRSCKMVSKAWVRLSVLFFFILPLVWLLIQIPSFIGGFFGGFIAFLFSLTTIIMMIWFMPYCFVTYAEAYERLS